jgi:2-polyprenyl-6-methoxyphenol hydroxylase-like FAD-dependent oxidoreductase
VNEGSRMTDEAPVLIAGGGLVGLSAAAFLASHGERARAGGAAIIQGAEIVDVRQDPAGVTLTIRDTRDASTREVRGD